MNLHLQNELFLNCSNCYPVPFLNKIFRTNSFLNQNYIEDSNEKTSRIPKQGRNSGKIPRKLRNGRETNFTQLQGFTSSSNFENDHISNIQLSIYQNIKPTIYLLELVLAIQKSTEMICVALKNRSASLDFHPFHTKLPERYEYFRFPPGCSFDLPTKFHQLQIPMHRSLPSDQTSDQTIFILTLNLIEIAKNEIGFASTMII